MENDNIKLNFWLGFITLLLVLVIWIALLVTVLSGINVFVTMPFSFIIGWWAGGLPMKAMKNNWAVRVLPLLHWVHKA